MRLGIVAGSSQWSGEAPWIRRDMSVPLTVSNYLKLSRDCCRSADRVVCVFISKLDA